MYVDHVIPNRVWLGEESNVRSLITFGMTAYTRNFTKKIDL